MTYLNSREYYEDLYDLTTIKLCLSHKKNFKSPSEKKKIGNRDMILQVEGLDRLFLYFITGDCYKERESTIQRWIANDKANEEKLNSALFPTSIRCPNCNNSMNEESRRLIESLDHPSRVQFIARCTECPKGVIAYDNGEIEVHESPKCPKCNSKLKRKSKFKENILTVVEKCTECEYQDTDITDFTKEDQERQKEKEKDQELLRKYRSEFCLSEKDGQEYIQSIERMHQLSELFKEQDRKKNDPAFQKAVSVEKLTASQLKKRLIRKLSKEGFINLIFNKPDINRYVIIPFTVEDSKTGRVKPESLKAFRRILTNVLDNTNWRLTSQGVDYRMGYLKGLLKGFENDEDLAKLISKRNSKKFVLDAKREGYIL